MLKDGKPYELTKDEAIRLHLQMWTDMQNELGDKPNPDERAVYKGNWLERHGYEGVEAHCFLCDYAQEAELQAWLANCGTHRICGYCPIDWSFLTCGAFVDKCYGRYRNGGGEVYQCAPISEILALPERKVNGRDA